MIPKFKDYFYPFLSVISNGNSYKTKQIKTEVAEFLRLSEEDLLIKTKGGQYQHFDRIKWTIVYLKRLGLIVSDVKGSWKISEQGKIALEQYREKLDLNVLRDMQGFKTSLKVKSEKSHWVCGHYRNNGTYVAGYYSNFKSKGIRKTKTFIRNCAENTDEAVTE